MSAGRDLTEKEVKGVIGIRRPATDTDKPEMIDSAKRRRWRLNIGDKEDFQAIWGLLSYVAVPIIIAFTCGVAIRLFLFTAGFREVF